MASIPNDEHEALNIGSTTTTTTADSMDLISKLKNYPHLIEKIFAHLKPKELRTIPCVCKSWHRILQASSPKAERRRLETVRKLRKLKKLKGQENWPIDVKCAKFKRKLSKQRKQQQTALESIQNLSRKNFDINNNHTDDGDQCSSFQNDYDVNDENDQNWANKRRKRWVLAQVPSKSW